MGALARKKIGLALGTGAARGLSYIGVLEILEENNIPIDYIAGSSMGALIGALYSSGMPLKQMKEEFKRLDWNNLADLEIPKKGLMKGDRAERKISGFISQKRFEDLDIPLAVITADLKTGNEVIFEKGDVAKAVRASVSIPIMFSPLEVNGMSLADGGIVNPLPVDIVRKMGADVIIAVDTSIPPYKAQFKELKRKNDLFNKIGFEYFKKFLILIDKRYFLRGSYSFLRRMIRPLFRAIFQPNMLMRFLSDREMPDILKVVETSNQIIINQLIKEKIKHEKIDVLIKPELEMYYIEFDKIDHCVKEGREATLKVLSRIKRRLK